MSNDEHFRTTIRQYKDGKIGKTLAAEVKINCRDFNDFVEIVESINKILKIKV